MNPMTPSRFARGVIRYAPLIALDGALAAVAFAIALILRYGGRIEDYYVDWFIQVAPVIAGAYALSAIGFNLYRRAWRYAGLPDLVDLTFAVALPTALLLVADVLADALGIFRGRPLPLSAIPVGGTLTYLALGGLRFGPRLRRFVASGRFPRGQTGVLIVGAGHAGQLLAREMLRNDEWRYQPTCFVDDDPAKQGLRVHGVPVRGTSADIPRLTRAYGASIVALAIPSATTEQMRRIVEICQPLAVRLLAVPGVREILSGQAGSTELREVRIEDLLGRAPIEVDLEACRSYLVGRVVLITGAAGSIGSELCRQVLALGPARLILLDTNESGIHDLALDLALTAGPSEIVPCVGSVVDQRKVSTLFARWHPQVIFHAAAYKHVPLMEEYPEEALTTNVLGTHTVARLAQRYGVERFVLVSTDKAVNPSNVMGAAKRLAELIIKDLATSGPSIFCAVRFGNVLGSRGSVVPIFTRQIERGGPITVTHPEMTRFFMTIPEAVSLIIEAGSFASPGDVFVLDMGEQIRIVDLAEKMARLRGLRVGQDIEIVYTGLRPGEKLAEELVAHGEGVHRTAHPKVLRLNGSGPIPRMNEVIARLEVLAQIRDREMIRRALLEAAQPPAASDPLAADGKGHRLASAFGH